MIRQLTGIRFLAAYLVLGHHFLIVEQAPLLTAFLDSVGDAAVSLFFVLSGFVLTLSNKKLDGTLLKSRADYLIARFARIYPQYLFAFLLAAPFAVSTTLAKHPELAQAAPRIAVNALAYLSLLQSWVPWLANAWNGPAWSLSVEAFFYIAFVWLVPPRAGQIGRWMGLAAAVAILPVVIGAAYNWPLPEATWLFFPPFRIGEFLLGMGVAQLYRQNSTNPRAAAVNEVLLYASLAALVGGLTLFDGVLARLTTTLAVPVALLSLARSGRGLSRFFASSPMVLLGDASYGLYLIQGPIFSICALIFGVEPHRWDLFLIYSAAAMAVSVAAHLYIEIPAAKKLKTMWKTRNLEIAHLDK